MIYYKILISFLIILIFQGCDEIILTYPNKPNESKTLFIDELSYINEIRQNSGLKAFARNQILTKAAKKHANYLAINHKSSHEEENLEAFYAKSPQQRALKSGYFYLGVGENIAFHKNSQIAIDLLFTAIYHRFGFLSFEYNEIGFANASNKNNFFPWVFVMGNSRLNYFCKNRKHDSGYGKFILNFCKDKEVKIKEDKFILNKKFSYKDIILFPYNKQNDIDISFSGEEPNPYPKCKITANPISIQFDNKLDIKFISFNLFKDNHEIKDIKIINHENDINKKFKKNEFAFFASEVFDFNKTYDFTFTYFHDKKVKTIKSSFTTKTPKNPYFIVQGNENLALMPDTLYTIFYKPKNCNDLIEKFNFKHKKYDNTYINFSLTNEIEVSLEGLKNDKSTLMINDDIKINLILQESSVAVIQNLKHRFLVSGVLIFFAILIAIYKKKDKFKNNII